MFQGKTWWDQEDISCKVKHQGEVGKGHTAPHKED